MSKKNVDVLFVYIVYSKTKEICAWNQEKRNEQKQSISGYGL